MKERFIKVKRWNNYYTMNKDILMNINMNCVLYLRVSSEEQVDNYSLSNQEYTCTKVAESRGLSIIETFREEGASAKTANRPALINLLEYCRTNKNNVSSVMVYRIDRLARQTSDYLAIRRKLFELGITLISATEPTGDSPTEKFVETLLAASAQLDNDVRGARSKQGLYQRFRDGLPIGKAPLGYQNATVDEKQVVTPNENEFELVKRGWNLMATGTKSTREMADIMNSWGLRINWGKKRFKLRSQTVCSIFRNIFYTGVLKYKKYPNEEKQGRYLPMINKELFYRVQDILDGRRTTPMGSKRKVDNPNFPLRKLVKCHYCGSPLTAGICKGNTKTYPYYWCRSNCLKTISSNKLEEILLDRLKEIQPSQEAIDLFTLILRTTYDKRIKTLHERKNAAGKELFELKEMMNKLVHGHLRGTYSDDIYESQKTLFEDKILSTEIVANDSTLEKYDIESTIIFIRALLKDLARAYEVSDYGQKQVLISSIFPSGFTFDSTRLLNSDISPIYRDIQAISKPDAHLWVEYETLLEPVLIPI